MSNASEPAFSANFDNSTASSVELEPVPAITGTLLLHSLTAISIIFLFFIIFYINKINNGNNSCIVSYVRLLFEVLI